MKSKGRFSGLCRYTECFPRMPVSVSPSRGQGAQKVSLVRCDGTDVEVVPDHRRGAAGLRVEPLLRHRRQVGRHPVEQHLQRAVAVAVAAAQPDGPEASGAARVGLDAHDVPVRHLVDEVPARRHVAAVGKRRRQRPRAAAEVGRHRLPPGREDHEAGVLAVRRPVLAGDLEPAHPLGDEEVPPPRHGDGVHVEGLLPPLPLLPVAAVEDHLLQAALEPGQAVPQALDADRVDPQLTGRYLDGRALFLTFDLRAPDLVAVGAEDENPSVPLPARRPHVAVGGECEGAPVGVVEVDCPEAADEMPCIPEEGPVCRHRLLLRPLSHKALPSVPVTTRGISGPRPYGSMRLAGSGSPRIRLFPIPVVPRHGGQDAAGDSSGPTVAKGPVPATRLLGTLGRSPRDGLPIRQDRKAGGFTSCRNRLQRRLSRRSTLFREPGNPEHFRCGPCIAGPAPLSPAPAFAAQQGFLPGLCCLLAACGGEPGPNDIAAEVGEELVYEREVDKLSAARPGVSRQELLQALVDRKLLLLEARARGLDRNRAFTGRLAWEVREKTINSYQADRVNARIAVTEEELQGAFRPGRLRTGETAAPVAGRNPRGSSSEVAPTLPGGRRRRDRRKTWATSTGSAPPGQASRPRSSPG